MMICQIPFSFSPARALTYDNEHHVVQCNERLSVNICSEECACIIMHIVNGGGRGMGRMGEEG